MASEMEKIESGERGPFNEICLPYTDYLEFSLWLKSVTEGYVPEAERYMDDVENQTKE